MTPFKERNAAEFKLHCACVAYLHGRLGVGKAQKQGDRPFLELFSREGEERFTHIYQGRSEEEGGLLKMMGLRPGVLDMLLWPRQGLLWMDFKVGTGLSGGQKTFVRDMREMRIPCHTPGSMQEFSDLLVAHGLTRRHDAIQEPDLRSKQEKRQQVFDMYKP